MRRKLYTVCAVLLLSLLIVLPASAGTGGPVNSGVQVQNLSPTDNATVSLDMYPQGGGSSVSLPPPPNIPGSTNVLPPLAAQNYYLPSYPTTTLPQGSYAMVVSSNAPLAAIARADWPQTGGAAIYSNVDPATDVVVPLITKNFANQTSQFTIQNTDTANDATDVVITLSGRGLSTPVVTTSAQTITKGTSKTYSMNDAMWGTLPNTGTDLGVPTGFVGSIEVTSSKPLVVESYIDVANSRGVGGFSGVPASSAATDLYCPLIRANYYGDTGISIVNTNGSAVTAQIAFTGDAQSKQGANQTFNQSVTVAAHSSAVPFQGPGGSSRAAGLPGGTGQTGANPTPTNTGFFGVAHITASAPVLAVVNDTKYGTGWSVQSQSSYNCVPAAQAGTQFALPLLRRYHLSDTKLTTGIQIQNIGATPITVHLALTNWNGTSQAASNPPDVTVPGHGSGNYWSGNLTGLPTVPPSAGGYGWFGSGILTVTGGTAAVVVSDEGFGSKAVDSANYNALKIQ